LDAISNMQMNNNIFHNTLQVRGNIVKLNNVIGTVEYNNFYNAENIISITNSSGLSINNNTSNQGAYIGCIKGYNSWNGDDYYVEITSPTYWGKNQNIFYYLYGQLFVKDSLEIAAGNVIKNEHSADRSNFLCSQ